MRRFLLGLGLVALIGWGCENAPHQNFSRQINGDQVSYTYQYNQRPRLQCSRNWELEIKKKRSGRKIGIHGFGYCGSTTEITNVCVDGRCYSHSSMGADKIFWEAEEQASRYFDAAKEAETQEALKKMK